MKETRTFKLGTNKCILKDCFSHSLMFNVKMVLYVLILIDNVLIRFVVSTVRLQRDSAHMIGCDFFFLIDVISSCSHLQIACHWNCIDLCENLNRPSYCFSSILNIKYGRKETDCGKKQKPSGGAAQKSWKYSCVLIVLQPSGADCIIKKQPPKNLQTQKSHPTLFWGLLVYILL